MRTAEDLWSNRNLWASGAQRPPRPSDAVRIAGRGRIPRSAPQGSRARTWCIRISITVLGATALALCIWAVLTLAPHAAPAGGGA